MVNLLKSVLLLAAVAMSAAVLVAPAHAARPIGANGATAQCRDSTYSHSAHRRGTCSHHGGVRVWLKRVPAIHHQAAKCPYNCTVHVSGYVTKKGAYVAPYNRRPPKR